MPGNPAPVTPVASRQAGDDVRGGIAMMAIGVLMLPVMDAVAKYLGATFGPIQIGLMRFVMQVAFTLPLALWFVGPIALRPRPFALQALRGTLIAAATCFFFAAVRVLPLADTMAIFFISPMVLTAISALFLGEKVGPRRWGAVLVGFVGALIIIRPGAGVFGAAALLPMGAACCYALYIVATRQIKGRSDPWSSNLQTGLFGALVLGAVLLAGDAAGVRLLQIVPIGLEHVGFFVVIGVIATVGHLLIIQAVARAPASVLAPIGYLEIVSATIIGYAWFGDVPDLWTVAGVVVIVTSGIYISYRENRLPRRAR